jgi:hypothetical protein
MDKTQADVSVEVPRADVLGITILRCITYIAIIVQNHICGFKTYLLMPTLLRILCENKWIENER